MHFQFNLQSLLQLQALASLNYFPCKSFRQTPLIHYCSRLHTFAAHLQLVQKMKMIDLLLHASHLFLNQKVSTPSFIYPHTLANGFYFRQLQRTFLLHLVLVKFKAKGLQILTLVSTMQDPFLHLKPYEHVTAAHFQSTFLPVPWLSGLAKEITINAIKIMKVPFI